MLPSGPLLSRWRFVATAGMMGLLAELDGSVGAGWPKPPASVLNVKQERSKNCEDH
jgi:hypothetical protein